MKAHDDLVKVRAEEILIGALVGVGAGIATVSPLLVGMSDLNPLSAPGLLGFARAALAWGVAVATGGAGAWLTARQVRDTHIRGAKYLQDYEQSAKALSVIQQRNFSESQKAAKVKGINVGGVEFSRTQETGHMYVVGLPGSGKTVLLAGMIDQILDRGDRILGHDSKGDFTARYFDPNTAVLLGPWDERAAVWDAASDISSPALADEFGASLAGKVEGQNKFFHDAAGRLIAGLIRAQMVAGTDWSWATLRDQLALPPMQLIRQAARGDKGIETAMPTPFLPVFPNVPPPDLTNGERAVLSVLGTATQWISNYAAIDTPERERFSLRKWLLREAHHGKTMVILNSSSAYEAAGQAIFGSMLATASATAASAAMPEISADEDGTWLILDEFPQLGSTALSQIQKIEEVGRSRGMRVVKALQDESQLIAVASRDKAEPMLSVQGARIYLRSSDKTADALSRRIGNADVERIETTVENGALCGKTRRIVQIPVVSQADLLGLRVRTGNDTPLGAEIIVHIEDTLARLVQPFPERKKPVAVPLVESQAWKMGSLPKPSLHELAQQAGEDLLTDLFGKASEGGSGGIQISDESARPSEPHEIHDAGDDGTECAEDEPSSDASWGTGADPFDFSDI